MTQTLSATRSRYSSVSIWLHWIIALLIIGNIIGGLGHDFWMESPDPAQKAIGRQILDLHKASGLLILLLTLVRIGWRVGHPWLPLPDHMTSLERLLARGTHWGFYALMLLMPLSGWAMVSTSRTVKPVSFFGLFDVPPLPLDRSVFGVMHEGHELMGWLMIATIALHIAGALKHQYFDHDDVLARMAPWTKPRA